MSRRIPKRKRIFIGAEGESEGSFAKWLKRICEQEGIHIHPDIVVCSGGDGLEVVLDAMAKHRKRINSHGAYEAGLIILDSDRISADRQYGRDPQEGLSDQNVKLVFLEPNLEGLFMRFHIGMERKSLTASDANRQIKRLWPQYSKPCNEAFQQKVKEQLMITDSRYGMKPYRRMLYTSIDPDGFQITEKSMPDE